LIYIVHLVIKALVRWSH